MVEAMSNPEDIHPRPIVSVDLAIFALTQDGLEVLLTKRGAEPFVGSWALPGGWIHVDEDRDLETAAQRVLTDKTGVATPYFEQVGVFGNTTRDPRGWSLSVTYMALITQNAVIPTQGGNVTDVAWHSISDEATMASLAFDHTAILKAAVTRLRNKVEYTTLPVHLLPEAFTLSELQTVYERLLGRVLDKSAFRKRMAEVDFIEPLAGKMRRGSNRPAQLYQLKQARSTAFFDRTI